jgi:hypothetical protein
MSDTSRRAFLVVAGAGAAGTVAATTGKAFADGSTRRKADSAQEPVVAYVRDHRSGELELMVGEREVIVRDVDLVNRILNAAGGE